MDDGDPRLGRSAPGSGNVVRDVHERLADILLDLIPVAQDVHETARERPAAGVGTAREQPVGVLERHATRGGHRLGDPPPELVSERLQLLPVFRAHPRAGEDLRRGLVGADRLELRLDPQFLEQSGKEQNLHRKAEEAELPPRMEMDPVGGAREVIVHEPGVFKRGRDPLAGFAQLENSVPELPRPGPAELGATDTEMQTANAGVVGGARNPEDQVGEGGPGIRKEQRRVRQRLRIRALGAEDEDAPVFHRRPVPNEQQRREAKKTEAREHGQRQHGAQQTTRPGSPPARRRRGRRREPRFSHGSLHPGHPMERG